MTAARVLATAVALLVPACRQDYHFDDQAMDAEVPDLAAMAADSSTPLDATMRAMDGEACPGSCGYHGGPCGNNPGCHLECQTGARCTASCADSCMAECGDGSRCSLATGARASLQCESRATCTFTVGVASGVACKDNSVCHVECVGRCTLSCGTGAQCDLRCPADAAPRLVTGQASCP